MWCWGRDEVGWRGEVRGWSGWAGRAVCLWESGWWRVDGWDWRWGGMLVIVFEPLPV